MANYNKSFNFKQGLQVDTDNFIINANGLVGIGTTIPRKTLDIYGDGFNNATVRVSGLTTTHSLHVDSTSQFNSDVTVGSNVDINASAGSVTATSFYGDGSTLSNIVGYSTDAWIINLARTGISTTFKVGIATNLTTYTHDLLIGGDPAITDDKGISFSALGGIRASGIITASEFDGGLNASNLTGSIDNARMPSSIDVSGTITADSDFIGDLQGTATTADNLSDAANITTGTINDDRLPDVITSNINISSGISTVNALDIGTNGERFTVLSTGKVGIGTANPVKDFDLIKTGAKAELQIISDDNIATLSIGKTATTLGVAGTEGGSLSYSNKKIELSNYDSGDLTFYLNRGGVGVNTGSFKWNYNSASTNLLTLTKEGYLGIKKSSPTKELDVSGSASISGNLDIVNDLDVQGSASFGTFSVSSFIIDNSTGICTFFDQHVKGTLGIAQTAQDDHKLDVHGTSRFNYDVGIGTTAGAGYHPSATNILSVKGDTLFDGSTIISGRVGVGTTGFDDTDGKYGDNQIHSKVTILDGDLNLKSVYNELIPELGVGINTTNARCVLDVGISTNSFFLPPVIDVSDVTIGSLGQAQSALANRIRYLDTGNALDSFAAGALVYLKHNTSNTWTNRHYAFNGTTWNKVW